MNVGKLSSKIVKLPSFQHLAAELWDLVFLLLTRWCGEQTADMAKLALLALVIIQADLACYLTYNEQT